MPNMTAAQHKGRLAYRSRKDVATSPEDLASFAAAYSAARLAEEVEKEVRLHHYTPEQTRVIVDLLQRQV